MSKAFDRTLKAWAAEFLGTLSDETRNLIMSANRDLWEGPHAEDGYPGFVRATLAIREALEDVPSTLWIDVGAEYWSTSEPKAEPCETCSGNGYDSDDQTCPDCTEGWVEPFTEETYRVERRDLVRALVGKELAEYL
jgi:hypothetical protein